VYRGLEVLSAAPDAEQRERLEHRLLSFVDPSEEFSAGRYAELAHAEIDSLLAEGRRPVVVGGTGLYLRAALADLDLRPPVPPEIREEVERELEERGPAALHAELDEELAAGVDQNDRKRIARFTELTRAGIEPARSSDRLWTADLRHQTVLVGLSMARGQLGERIDARVDEMVASAAADEARQAAAAGASRLGTMPTWPVKSSSCSIARTGDTGPMTRRSPQNESVVCAFENRLFTSIRFLEGADR
jgi:tRNA dimethylallyltransferase